MTYLFTDFRVLSAVPASGECRAEELYTALCASMQFPLPVDCLASALAVLVADGYVTVDTPEKVSANTTVTLTEKGQATVAVSGLAKMLASWREREMGRLEERFCALPRPAVPSYAVDGETFASAATAAGRLYANEVFLALAGEVNGDLSLTFYGSAPTYDEESSQGDTPVTVTGTADTAKQAVAHLLDTASAWLHESPRTRKVAVHGRNMSLVVTFAYAVEDNGTSVLRMTAAPIRFNRNRFVGKRDSDLDYAQCGDPLLSMSFSPSRETIARLILPVAVSMPQLLDDDMAETVADLHKTMR